MSLPYGRELVRADLDALPDDGHRHELIDGVLVATPAPRFRHQDAVGGLYTVLRAALPAGLARVAARLTASGIGQLGFGGAEC
ncbi:MAG: Uma2 family endonuclease [Microbacterium sp.]